MKRTTTPPWETKFLPRHLIVIFLLLSIGLTVVGYVYYQTQKKQLRMEIQDNLSAIADFKVKDIVRWRKERLGDAKTIQKNTSVLRRIEQFLANPSSLETRNEIAAWTNSLKEDYGYRGVVLLDLEKRVKLSSLGPTQSVGKETSALAAEAIRTDKVIFSDLRWGETEKVIRLDILIPLMGPESQRAIGVLLLRIDPLEYIFPLIQSWPTQSATAETLLVRREGHDVVYLNELRHRRGTALTLRLPLSNEQLPATHAIQGKEGIVEGRDYRGVSVLAATRAIPDSPWYLVAKIDTAEVYAPIREHFWIVLVSVCIMIFMSGLILDYIWRKQSEAYLLASRQQIQDILESITDCFYSLDHAWRVTQINDRALRYFGMKREDFLGKVWWDVFPMARGSIFEERYKKVVAEQAPVHFETPSPVVDKWAEIHAYPAEEGLAVYFRDISERKEAEEEIRELSQRLSYHVENSPLAVIEWGPDMRLTRWSGEAERIFGWCAEEVLGKRMEDFRWIYQEDEPQVSEVSAELRAGSNPRRFSANRNYRKDGTVIHCEWYNSSMLDGEGNLRSILSLVLDVTERKRMEETITERNRQLEAANKELDDFSYSVSHDLRAPLRAIDGFSRMLLRDQKEKLDEDSGRRLNVIRDNVQRMGQLIDDLLDFSRLGRKAMSPSVLDMEALVKEVWDDQGTINPGRQMTLQNGHLPEAYGDRSLVRQVLANLLSNAVKFTGSRGHAWIEVGGRNEGRENLYYVKDNGVGFDMRYHDKLFGVFQRLHSQEEYEGTGVGLAIVQRIIQRHGGRLWAEGQVDAGATFYFTLPGKGESIP